MKNMISDYLDKGLSTKKRKRIIDRFYKKINKEIGSKNFNAIAISGMSGALIGISLSNRLNKHIIIIRKKIKESHSTHSYEGVKVNKLKYLIIDDFIESGRTIRKIKKEIEKTNNESKCIGIIFYNKYACCLPGSQIFEIFKRKIPILF